MNPSSESRHMNPSSEPRHMNPSSESRHMKLSSESRYMNFPYESRHTKPPKPVIPPPVIRGQQHRHTNNSNHHELGHIYRLNCFGASIRFMNYSRHKSTSLFNLRVDMSHHVSMHRDKHAVYHHQLSQRGPGGVGVRLPIIVSQLTPQLYIHLSQLTPQSYIPPLQLTSQSYICVSQLKA